MCGQFFYLRLDVHVLTKKTMMHLFRATAMYIRWGIVSIVLIVLVIGIVGFILKWSPQFLLPQNVLSDYRAITEDIFSLLVVYELLDLLRTLSPNRLMDIILLTIARKIVLAPNNADLLLEVISCAVILCMRLIWQKVIQELKEVEID